MCSGLNKPARLQKKTNATLTSPTTHNQHKGTKSMNKPDERAYEAFEAASKDVDCFNTPCKDCFLNLSDRNNPTRNKCIITIYRNNFLKLKSLYDLQQRELELRKQIESMIRALQLVKKDDWRIVRIENHDNTSHAVAFVHKDDPLAPYMNELKEDNAYNKNSIMDKTMVKIRLALDKKINEGEEFFSTRDKIYKILNIEEKSNA